MVEASWNVMAHGQTPDFVFRRNGRVHLNRRGLQFCRLLAVELCAWAVVMLDTPYSEVVWRVLVTHSIRQFSFHFPFRAPPCAITFQLGYIMLSCMVVRRWRCTDCCSSEILFSVRGLAVQKRRTRITGQGFLRILFPGKRRAENGAERVSKFTAYLLWLGKDLLGRSQWPRGLRRRSAPALLLRLWVRNPPGAWMSVCCECCMLSGRGICDGLITRPEESYRLWYVVVCDLETSRMRRPWAALGHSATGE